MPSVTQVGSGGIATVFFAMLAAMGLVLLTWGVLGVAFVGIGRWVWRGAGMAGGPLASKGDQASTAFWLGWCAVLCFLQLWNFWLPVDRPALLIVCSTGLVGVALDLNWWAGCMAELKARPRLVTALLLVAVWLSNRVLGPGNAHDSGLYHYNVIRWANEYPVVPGLGNLNAAFALNNASFLYHAMLNTGPWAGRGNHLGNGLLLFGFFARVVPSVRLVWARSSRCRPEHVFDVVLLPAAVMLALGKDLPSPKTDLPPGLLSLVFARLLLGFCIEPVERKTAASVRGRPEPSVGWVFVFSLYAATLVILKLSSAVLAAGFGALGVWAWARRAAAAESLPVVAEFRPPKRTQRGLQGRMIAAVVVPGLLWVGPWVGRNVVLSGYPVYPAKVAAVSPDWRVPAPAVDFLQNAIRLQAKGNLALWLHGKLAETKLAWYARVMKPSFTSVEQIHGINWLGPWLLTLPVSGPIEILLPGLIVGWALYTRWRSRDGSSPGGTVWRGMVLVPVAALAFWVWAGPDPRYGWASAWCLAGLMVARVYERAAGGRMRLGLRRVAVVGAVLTFPTLAFRVSVLAVQAQGPPLRQVPFQWPGPDHGFHPTPVVPLKAMTNGHGVWLYVPVDPDETLTWGGPLPCTGAWPPINPNLSLRRPGDLGAGFRETR